MSSEVRVKFGQNQREALDAGTSANSSCTGSARLASGGFIKGVQCGTATIRRIEKSDNPMTGYVLTLVRIQTAFEDAGVQFIDADELTGIGLRLAKKKRGDKVAHTLI